MRTINIYLDDMRCSPEGCRHCFHVRPDFIRSMRQVLTCDKASEFTHFTSVDAVKHLLTQMHTTGDVRVVLMSLDHDLGACAECVNGQKHIGDMTTPETTFLNWCPHVEDGTKLVNWMEETGYWPIYPPVVHSHNPVGRERMRRAIVRHYPGN